MADGDLASMMAGSQPSSLLNYAVNPNANGFDFGMSQPKTGLGYGLLGDTRSLSSNQSCDDCAPTDPCPNCATSDDDGVDGRGQIIKAQGPFAVPMPDFLPPTPPIITPAHPAQTPIIGDPEAPWNWGPDEWSKWAHGIFESRGPSKAVEKACEDQVNSEIKRCYALARRTTAEAGPQRGARELKSCRDNAEVRYSECRVNNGKSKTPLYPDWYEDPPYPDDFED